MDYGGEAALPDGVLRDDHCLKSVNLDNCHAVQFELEYQEGGVGSVIVWRDGARMITPLSKGQRLRDLRAGDKVSAYGKPATVTATIVYR